MPRPVITKRLILRHDAPGHTPRLATLISVAGVQPWLPRVPHPYTESDAEAFTARAMLAAWFGENEKDVASGHRLGNEASRRVLRKLGFQDNTESTFHSSFEAGPIALQDMTLTRAAFKAAA